MSFGKAFIRNLFCGFAALLVLSGLVLSGAAQADNKPSIVMFAYDVVDLTHTYNDETIYWPTETKGFQMKEQAHGFVEGGWFYSSYAITTPEHGGTHMDAPYHFEQRGEKANEVSPRRFIGHAIVIDVSKQARKNPDYLLTKKDIKKFEKEHGKIEQGAIVVMRTDWSKHWPDRKKYLGDDRPGRTDDLHFPSFGKEAAQFLIEKRKAKMIGVDTASIDYGQSKDFIVHRIAGSRNVPGLENLTNLDQLPPKGAMIIALPMKIGGGSGAPVRVIALVPGTD